MRRYVIELTAMDEKSLHMEVHREVAPSEDKDEIYVIDKVLDAIMKTLSDVYNLHPIPDKEKLN